MRMKSAFASLMVLLPLAAIGATATPDSAFYKQAAEGGLSEVDQGNLAQQKSSKQSVKDFGAMMVKDHSAANEKLKEIAAAKNIKLPTGESGKQMAAQAKLEVLSGDTFDKSYIQGMIKDHEEDIALFKKEAASGQDPDAKAFAGETLPTLRMHLKKIKAVAAEAGVASDTHR